MQSRTERLRAIAARYRRLIAVAIAALLVALGLAAVDRLTSEIHARDVGAALHTLPASHVAVAIGLTIASYLALTVYDVLALRIIGKPLPWRTAALASFTSYTLSHNLGLALLTGGSARYRVYTAAGLEGSDVARVVALASAAFWSGVIAIAGTALLFHRGALALPGLYLSGPEADALGALMLAGFVAALAIAKMAPRPLRVFGFVLPLPAPSHLLAQTAVAMADLACAGAALFVLMPDAAPALLPAFILAYTLGIIVAAVTHVPGGIGMFEAVVLSVLPGDRATLLAALVAYRVIYYLLPLACGVVLLAWHEGRQQRRTRQILSGAQAIASGLAPTALAAATFAGGAVLLLSGSLPSIHGRMGALATILPLPFIEASHIAASLVGTALLLIAPGLYRRLDGANLAARALLVAGALFSLAKGIDYEEAVACLALATLLHWTRGAFYRHTAMMRAPITSAWLASVVATLGLSLWAGFFAFRRVPYADDLWWRFALHGDAPRFLRASLAVAVLLLAFTVWRLMAPARSAEREASGAVPRDTLAPALDRAERTDAMLALTGDKHFLFSEDRDAFVMYGVAGSTWVVMGDPIGPREAWLDLLWRLRERADQAQGRLLLYEISAPALELAIGMGLRIMKFGEEALIDLPAFRLDVPELRSARRAARAAANKGADFRIVPAGEVPAIMDELELVSNEWLTGKEQEEKSFSLGRFSRSYIEQFDVAVVTVGGRIVAFANLWLTPNRHEASVDLMRHRMDAPAGTMDYLFAELMLWARREGYARFSLGMAPLSGIEDRRLAPAWARIGAFVFRHGERLYGFRGLRAYKEKFAPHWEARYVAGPGGLGLALGLRDLSRLVEARSTPGAAPSEKPRRHAGPAAVPVAALAT